MDNQILHNLIFSPYLIHILLPSFIVTSGRTIQQLLKTQSRLLSHIDIIIHRRRSTSSRSRRRRSRARSFILLLASPIAIPAYMSAHLLSPSPPSKQLTYPCPTPPASSSAYPEQAAVHPLPSSPHDATDPPSYYHSDRRAYHPYPRVCASVAVIWIFPRERSDRCLPAGAWSRPSVSGCDFGLCHDYLLRCGRRGFDPAL